MPTLNSNTERAFVRLQLGFNINENFAEKIFNHKVILRILLQIRTDLLAGSVPKAIGGAL